MAAVKNGGISVDATEGFIDAGAFPSRLNSSILPIVMTAGHDILL
jgi:hypothetical protein